MICKICGKPCSDKLNHFGYHLSITHKIKYKEYYDTYIKSDTDGKCAVCGKPTSWRRNHYLVCCSNKCGTIYSQNKREQTMLERYGGKTTLESASLTKQMRKTCKDLYGTENPGSFGGDIFETAMKNKYGVKSFLETFTSEEKTIYGRLGHTPEAEEKYRQTMFEKYGVYHPTLNYETFKKMKRKYKYNNLNFDSGSEIYYYIWLKDHNIDFEYQPNEVFDYSYNKVSLHYRPDFKVGNEIHEIKGLQFFENKNPKNRMINPYDRSQDDLYEAKHQCMIKNNVKIITDFREFEKYVNEKYGKDYIKQFKRD